jgi:hypothetical protein
VDAQAVDQHVVALRDAADGAAHGEVRGVVDVQPIDLRDARGPQPHGDRSTANDRCQPLALRWRQHLRVPHAGDASGVRRHHHGGGENRSGEAGDAHGIGSDDQVAAGAPVGTLDAR